MPPHLRSPCLPPPSPPQKTHMEQISYTILLVVEAVLYSPAEPQGSALKLHSSLQQFAWTEAEVRGAVRSCAWLQRQRPPCAMPTLRDIPPSFRWRLTPPAGAGGVRAARLPRGAAVLLRDEPQALLLQPAHLPALPGGWLLGGRAQLGFLALRRAPAPCTLPPTCVHSHAPGLPSPTALPLALHPLLLPPPSLSFPSAGEHRVQPGNRLGALRLHPPRVAARPQARHELPAGLGGRRPGRLLPRHPVPRQHQGRRQGAAAGSSGRTG